MPKDASFEFYVKDRNASVRFTGRSFVLPRIGQNGIPVISVNSPKAKLALYRIGDRNLISSVVNSDFRQQISGYGAQNIADRLGKEVWAGEMDTPAGLRYCIRVLIHWNTDKKAAEIRHVYLHSAAQLRPDRAATRA